MQKENQIESKIRILLMVTGILLIGLCVSFLRIAGFGVDPFSGMILQLVDLLDGHLVTGNLL